MTAIQNPITRSFYEHFSMPVENNTIVPLEEIRPSVLQLVIQIEETRQRVFKLITALSNGMAEEELDFWNKHIEIEPIHAVFQTALSAATLEKLSSKEGTGDNVGASLALLSVVVDPRNKDLDELSLLGKTNPKLAIALQALYNFRDGVMPSMLDIDIFLKDHLEECKNRPVILQIIRERKHLMALTLKLHAMIPKRILNIDFDRGVTVVWKKQRRFIAELAEFFAQNSKKVCILEWFNYTENMGTKLVIDLSKKRFFDPYLGFYKYSSLTTCLVGLIEVAMKSYQGRFFPTKELGHTSDKIEWRFVPANFREKAKL